jgi:hypothetical protein
MGLNVLYVHDVESFVLAGIVLSVRGASRQGYDEQYMAGVLAHAEHVCLSAKGDWPDTLQRARALLQGSQCLMLDNALRLQARAP